MDKGEDVMKRPKNATHELNGTYYKKSCGVEVYHPYSKTSGRLFNVGHVFEDSKNKPVLISEEM
jgi:hypothetical protein